MSHLTGSRHEVSHQKATENDAHTKYTIGDELEVVVEQTPAMNNGREAVARLDALVVWKHKI